MNREELLEKAKKDYPIGSKVTSIVGFTDIIDGFDYVSFTNDDIWFSGVKYGMLVYRHDDRSWAKLLSPPPSRNIKIPKIAEEI